MPLEFIYDNCVCMYSVLRTELASHAQSLHPCVNALAIPLELVQLQGKLLMCLIKYCALGLYSQRFIMHVTQSIYCAFDIVHEHVIHTIHALGLGPS